MPTVAASDRALHPERALTSWSWIAALALLALNDHWLKGAGILPGWLTGKLSDFAGLYVAPALLAALLRTRSPAGLVACHAAVLAVFAAINLDPRCAALLASALGVLGFEWRIVTDAADLIALPALLGSWSWLRRAMGTAAPTRARRAVQHALSAAGLLLCMATSDPGGPWGIWSGGPHLHNSSRSDITVLVRPLRASVQLDCDAIGQDPGKLLPDAAFGVAVAFQLGAHENVALDAPVDRACSAVSISGTGLQPAIVFWRSVDAFTQDVPSEYGDEDEWDDGAIGLLFDGDRHTGYRSVGGDYVFEVERRPPELGEACAAADEGARPALSSDLAAGRVRLLAVDEGPDGCVALRTARASAGDGSSGDDDTDADAGLADDDAGTAVAEPDDEPIDPGDQVALASAYVCLPRGMFPFGVGDVVEIAQGAEELDSVRISERAADGLPRTELVIASIEESAFIASLDLRVTPRASCGFVLDERCAQTSVPADVRIDVGGDERVVRAGAEPEVIVLRDREVTVAAPLAQQRALVDTECAAGPDRAGIDATVVVVVRWGGT